MKEPGSPQQLVVIPLDSWIAAKRLLGTWLDSTYEREDAPLPPISKTIDFLAEEVEDS